MNLIKNSQETHENTQKLEKTEENEPELHEKLEVFTEKPQIKQEIREICERDTVISLEKEDEDTVFSRFFMLSEGKVARNSENVLRDEENFSETARIFEKNKRSWIYKYLCCCIVKEEDDFYSHF